MISHHPLNMNKLWCTLTLYQSHIQQNKIKVGMFNTFLKPNTKLVTVDINTSIIDFIILNVGLILRVVSKWYLSICYLLGPTIFLVVFLAPSFFLLSILVLFLIVVFFISRFWVLKIFKNSKFSYHDIIFVIISVLKRVYKTHLKATYLQHMPMNNWPAWIFNHFFPMLQF